MSPDVRAQVRVSLEGAAEAAAGGPRGRPEDRHPFRAGVGARVASLRCPILLSSLSMVLRLADSVKRKPSILEEKSDKSRGFGGGAPILRMICFLGPEGETTLPACASPQISRVICKRPPYMA